MHVGRCTHRARAAPLSLKNAHQSLPCGVAAPRIRPRHRSRVRQHVCGTCVQYLPLCIAAGSLQIRRVHAATLHVERMRRVASELSMPAKVAGTTTHCWQHWPSAVARRCRLRRYNMRL